MKIINTLQFQRGCFRVGGSRSLIWGVHIWSPTCRERGSPLQSRGRRVQAKDQWGEGPQRMRWAYLMCSSKAKLLACERGVSAERWNGREGRGQIAEGLTPEWILSMKGNVVGFAVLLWFTFKRPVPSAENGLQQGKYGSWEFSRPGMQTRRGGVKDGRREDEAVDGVEGLAMGGWGEWTGSVVTFEVLA